MFAVDWSTGIEDAWSDLAKFAPKVVAALVVLVVGWFIARVIRKVIERVLTKIRFDQYVDKAGIGAPIERAGYPDSGKLLAKLLYYGIMLIVLQLAVSVFGDSAVNEAFGGLIAFIRSEKLSMSISRDLRSSSGAKGSEGLPARSAMTPTTNGSWIFFSAP